MMKNLRLWEEKADGVHRLPPGSHGPFRRGQVAPLSRPDVSVKDVTASEAVEDVFLWQLVWIL